MKVAMIVALAVSFVLAPRVPDARADSETRSPTTATWISLNCTLLPAAVGLALAVDGSNEPAAALLLVGGGLLGPATGLVYGHCNLHAAVGVGLRAAGMVIALQGVGLEIEVGGGGPAIWGGLGLCAASVVYDLATVANCTRRHNPEPTAALVPSLRVVPLHGAPALAVGVSF